MMVEVDFYTTREPALRTRRALAIADHYVDDPGDVGLVMTGKNDVLFVTYSVGSGPKITNTYHWHHGQWLLDEVDR